MKQKKSFFFLKNSKLGPSVIFWNFPVLKWTSLTTENLFQKKLNFLKFSEFCNFSTIIFFRICCFKKFGKIPIFTKFFGIFFYLTLLKFEFCLFARAHFHHLQFKSQQLCLLEEVGHQQCFRELRVQIVHYHFGPSSFRPLSVLPCRNLDLFARRRFPTTCLLVDQTERVTFWEHVHVHQVAEINFCIYH